MLSRNSVSLYTQEQSPVSRQVFGWVVFALLFAAGIAAAALYHLSHDRGGDVANDGTFLIAAISFVIAAGVGNRTAGK